VRLPVELVDILSPDDGEEPPEVRQAFALLTVADSGHPHVCLLSSAQLRVADDHEAVLVSVFGRSTRRHLDGRRLATLVAVGGATAYYVEFAVVDTVDVDDRRGYTLAVGGVLTDTAGVDLLPLRFRYRSELAEAERWSVDQKVLATLQQQHRRSAEAGL
jgi:hypothetical protein